MIHILLMILKIIGIIIAAILGLLFLLLVIFLCVPVRYCLEASMSGEIKKSRVHGKVTWLLHLIRVDVALEEQNLKWKARIAWKSFGSGADERKSERKKAHEKENDQDRKEKRKEQRVESDSGLQKVEKEPEKEERPVKSVKTHAENMEKGTGKKIEKSPENISEKNQGNIEKVQSEKNSEKIEKTEKIEEKSGRFEKIKCTIVKFCDKIKHTVRHTEETLENLSEKKERIVKELEDPVHRKAFSKVKKELGKLLKRWRPKVMEGNVHFGFEDPYHTGQALAALSIVYPFIGGRLSVEPDFEQRILEGNVKIHGGICVMPLVCLLWNLVWCKEIRKTYHDVRNFKW